MALPTNFTDQKIDRVQNQDRKYIQTTNSDGTVSFTDVTIYEDNGSQATAQNMNATNLQVNLNTNKIGTEPLNTASQNLCGAINEQQNEIDDINNSLTVLIEGTLTQGNDTVTLTDPRIKTTSIIDIYTDVWGVSPKSVEVIQDGILELVFPIQQTNVNIRVRCL